MSPITHGLMGWLIGESARLDRRGRAVVTIAGVIPDVDGFGLPVELLTRHSERPLLWWADFHHVLGHNLAFALVVALGAWAWTRRPLVAALALLSFHLHLFCDLIGGRGPDGHHYPIQYWWPFGDGAGWTWSGQWELNAWPNFVVTGLALIATIVLALRRGRTPIEIVSLRADAAVVAVLRRRLGRCPTSSVDTRSDT
ncbi:MAG: metal-dependent hydrolase [Planctomycetes bacterium]|nr:metal-dependent hydrolase [Planctomycetota bacterium]